MEVPGLIIDYSGGVNRLDMPWLQYRSEYHAGDLLCTIFQGETLYNISGILQKCINYYPQNEEPVTTDNIEEAEGFVYQSLTYDDFIPAQVLAQGSFIYWMEKCRAMCTASRDRFLDSACELADGGGLPYLDIGFSSMGQFLRLCFNNYYTDLVNAVQLFNTIAAVKSGTATAEEKSKYERLRILLSVRGAVPDIGIRTAYDPSEGKFRYSCIISSFLAMAVFELSHIEESKMKVLRCQNPECGKYFTAKRSSARYCGFAAPQCGSHPCNKYYPQIAYRAKVRESEVSHLIKNAKCRLYNARRRHPEDSDKISSLISDLTIKADEKTEKVLNKDMTIPQFKSWLETFYYRKGNSDYE